jgi:hypothetical protein
MLRTGEEERRGAVRASGDARSQRLHYLHATRTYKERLLPAVNLCGYDARMITAIEVARGVSRLLVQQGFSPILEFTLANGRRLDVAALGPDGTVAGVEIKVAVPDLKGDLKWPEYLDFCELFYFAIPPDFPDALVPAQTGLIVADRYGGAIIRPSPMAQLHASRRKAVTLRFAKVAAERLAMALDGALAPTPLQGVVSSEW